MELCEDVSGDELMVGGAGHEWDDPTSDELVKLVLGSLPGDKVCKTDVRLRLNHAFTFGPDYVAALRRAFLLASIAKAAGIGSLAPRRAGSCRAWDANLGEVTLQLASDGSHTVRDASGTTPLEHGTLTPVADTSSMYGAADELQDPCNGLFTYRPTKATSREDSFVTLVGRAMLFSSFTSPLPSSSTYDYQYGVALKTTT